MRLKNMVITLAAVAIMVGLAIAPSADDRELADLKHDFDSLSVERDSLDVELTAYAHLRTLDSAYNQELEAANDRLRRDLTLQRRTTAAVTARRDSIQATIREDTLSAGVRALLGAERGIATSALAERDILAGLLTSAQQYAERLDRRLREADQLLVLTVGQRDAALELVQRHEDRLGFHLFGNLKARAVCAGGGGLTAATMGGNILIGAGIGLAACLIGEAL